jgi:hypothetical protein
MAGKKKARRKRDALLLRELLNGSTPAPGDAVALPLVNGLATPVGVLYAVSPQGPDDGRSAAELVDQGRVFMLHRGAQSEISSALSRGVVAEDSFGDPPKPVRHDDGMPKKDERKPFDIECGRRLRSARFALGYSVLARFAENTGTNEDNLSNWERGISLVPADYVQRLKEVFGVSHDWIYGEDASCMKPELAMQILSVDKRRQ